MLEVIQSTVDWLHEGDNWLLPVALSAAFAFSKSASGWIVSD